MRGIYVKQLTCPTVFHQFLALVTAHKLLHHERDNTVRHHSMRKSGAERNTFRACYIKGSQSPDSFTNNCFAM